MAITRTKEQALDHFLMVIEQSWTWEKLTPEERNRYYDAIPRNLKGTFSQRYETLQATYSAFLYGIGYKPIGWR